jgi:hypothetical protein
VVVGIGVIVYLTKKYSGNLKKQNQDFEAQIAKMDQQIDKEAGSTSES